MARFSESVSLSRDAAGNLYVLDGDLATQLIRKISPAGRVTTLIGAPSPYNPLNGTYTTPALSGMYQVSSDAAGNVYAANYFAIFKITPAGVISTLAGERNSPGQLDGNGTAARFSFISRLSCDAAGNIYVLDGSALRKISPSGEVSTLAGQAEASGSSDGLGKAARFNSPVAMVADSTGNLYVADTGNYTIRKITPAGMVSTLDGSGQFGDSNGKGTGRALATCTRWL